MELTTGAKPLPRQERIKGLNVSSPEVIARLESLHVPDHLIAFIFAKRMLENEWLQQDILNKAESDIIDWAKKEWKLDDESALRVLNGQTTVTQEQDFKIDNSGLV